MAKFARQEGLEILHRAGGSGYVDTKGRELGFAGSVWPITWTRLPDDASCWNSDQERSLQYRYLVRVQATRAGRPFGASQPGRSFRTLEEATTYLDETIASRIQKLAVKYGKQHAPESLCVLCHLPSSVHGHGETGRFDSHAFQAELETEGGRQ